MHYYFLSKYNLHVWFDIFFSLLNLNKFSFILYLLFKTLFVNYKLTLWYVSYSSRADFFFRTQLLATGDGAGNICIFKLSSELLTSSVKELEQLATLINTGTEWNFQLLVLNCDFFQEELWIFIVWKSGSRIHSKPDKYWG